METKKSTPPLSGVALGKWMTEQKKAEQKRMREEYQTNPEIRAVYDELKKRMQDRGTAKITL